MVKIGSPPKTTHAMVAGTCESPCWLTEAQSCHVRSALRKRRRCVALFFSNTLSHTEQAVVTILALTVVMTRGEIYRAPNLAAEEAT